MVCTHGNKTNHLEDKCFFKHEFSTNYKPKSKQGKQGNSKKNEQVNQIKTIENENNNPNEYNFMVQDETETSTIPTNSKCSKWTVDFGATRHICNNLALFTAISTTAQTLKWVTVASRKCLEVKRERLVYMTLKDMNRKLIKIILYDTIFVSRVTNHLISIKKIAKQLHDVNLY